MYNKRNGLRGVISGYDSLTVTIDIGGEEQNITQATFKRWWTLVPMDEPEEEPVPETIEEVVEAFEPEATGSIENFDDADIEKYVGYKLLRRFLRLLQALRDDDLTYQYFPKYKMYAIRYRGYNIFEVYPKRKRLILLAHPESLTPANTKRVSHMYPKEHGWALRAKFVFDTDDIGASQVMKTVIADGMFYRSQSKPRGKAPKETN